MRRCVILALIAAISCAEQGSSFQAATRVIYAFGDASVEPQYHRSYIIEATSDSVHVVVDSYGDVLADTTMSLDDGRFQRLLDELEGAGLHKVARTGQEGCSGGTTEELVVLQGEESLFSGRAYHCGGYTYGTIGGDLSAASAAVKELVPNLCVLTE